MTIARTPSEARLASLHLDFTELNLKPRKAALPSNTHQSRLTDDDLEGLEFPSLGKSVVEEQETQFAMLATKALSFLATPESDREVYSPYTNRSPLPDCDADANPYFTQRRNLYHDGADSWTPRSFSSSSSSSTADSDYSSSASSYDAPSPLAQPQHSIPRTLHSPLAVESPSTSSCRQHRTCSANSSARLAQPRASRSPRLRLACSRTILVESRSAQGVLECSRMILKARSRRRCEGSRGVMGSLSEGWSTGE
ncbi:hypothetical protein BCR35DRAFT_195761 [Leucosporidium creatinivorum]|uniref:Uncharacterized protein n=1 Tax=Leucosporidium creatinivorum TaxID=106004 RepID=A0A1Y2DRM9_9BASI|nr:hypothetical protein BCR35DRAFT_195761 [Leucosporidium creatinivorum]